MNSIKFNQVSCFILRSYVKTQQKKKQFLLCDITLFISNVPLITFKNDLHPSACSIPRVWEVTPVMGIVLAREGSKRENGS
jgi:hypothetical protein